MKKLLRQIAYHSGKRFFKQQEKIIYTTKEIHKRFLGIFEESLTN